MMLVDAVEIREVVVPFHAPFRSAGAELTERRLFLIRLGAGGAEGWGECGPIPGYGADTFAAARRSLEASVDRILGRPVPDGLEFASDLDSVASPSARFALECALLDLAGHVSGFQVWKRLGGRRPRIPVGVVIPTGAAADVTGAAAAAAAAGYRRIKLKVTSPADLDLVKAIAASMENTDLAVDANGAFSRADLGSLEKIDDLGLCFVEQPFPPDDISTSAELAGRIETPICLDESITSAGVARRVLEAGAGSMIVVKPARLGGFGASRDVLHVAAAAGAGVWVGGMLESGIGRAAALAAATMPGITAPADLAPPRRLLATDLLRAPWPIRKGVVEIPPRDGLGIDVDLEAVEELTVEVDHYGKTF